MEISQTLLNKYHHRDYNEYAYTYVMTDGTKWTICELWIPTKDEWCVFYSNCDIYNKYMIRKYSTSMHDGEWFKVQTNINCIDKYANIAPIELIQTLKD